MPITKEKSETQIDRRLVCQYIGYTPEAEPSPRISSLLDEYIENANHLIDPAYDCVMKDVLEVSGDRAVLEGDIVFESKVISGLLERCDRVAIFVLSIGNRLEEIAAKLAEERMIVESYVLDAIGSSAVENLADYVQGAVWELANHRGLSISRRFSPGYCDWNINQQQMVFRGLEGQTSLVQLSPENLMFPQKSISGIIGIGSREKEITRYNPCKTCEKRNCVGRR